MLKRSKKFLDTEDSAAFLGYKSPETVRVLVRQKKLLPVDRSPPFTFSREVLEQFRKPKIGRPRKSQEKEVGKNG